MDDRNPQERTERGRNGPSPAPNATRCTGGGSECRRRRRVLVQPFLLVSTVHGSHATAPRTIWIRGVSPGTAAGYRPGDGRSKCARRDADGQRKVALLPITGARASRVDARRVSPNRPHERSSGPTEPVRSAGYSN